MYLGCIVRFGTLCIDLPQECKMKSKTLITVCCLFVTLALFPIDLKAEEMVLKLASWGPSKHYAYTARNNWIKEVNEACAGKIKIVEYPGGQLFGPKEMHKAVAKGQVDIGVILQPAMLAMVPMLQGVYLPFAFDNVDDVAKAYSGESLAIIEKAMEKKRIKLIYTSYTDGVQIYSNKKNIETIDDFKGLRILSTSPIFAEIMSKLGAAPDTSIPQTEQYMALKRKIADANANSTVGGYFQRSHEVAPFMTKIDCSFATILVCMNTKKWAKLPEDVQKIMVETGRKHGQITLAAAKGWEAKFLDEMKKEGASVTVLPEAERAKIKEVSRAIWIKWAEKNGPEAKRLLELNTGIK